MTSKPELFARIEQTFSQLTPSEKRVAGWLLAHAAQIPFETADGIAKAAGTSALPSGVTCVNSGFVTWKMRKPACVKYPLFPISHGE